MSSDDYLFVYGTLRGGVLRSDAGERAFSQLEADASFMGLATMDGRLFEVDGYPAGCYQFAVGSDVIGDLYQVDAAAALFVTLDAYEESDPHFEQPREYQRQRVPVSLSDGSVVYAWVYLYHRSIDALLMIESGDYLLWQKQNETITGDIKLD
ncbi:MAG: gamma-glutamylcyclotransferase [Gammaproteobacteria bacterium]|nr:gamma-glutamylcyclotransferase [Gammaproteobacteria bacterium]